MTAVRVDVTGWGWRPATRLAWSVSGVDLHVEPGERVLLLGPSGSGKSTLLAGLAGLLDPADPDAGQAQGRILLDGVPARQARASGRARTGLLLQDPTAQTVMARAGDDVAFGCENHGVPRELIWPRVRQALDDVGFPYGLDHPTSRLSGGERQRLALAGVLALRPGLLLLDEPTAMLDPAAAAGLREVLLRALAESGATCVLVEHRVENWVGPGRPASGARDAVDRVVVLASAQAGGGVVADGPPGEVLGRHGAALAAQGVWVPGHELRTDRLPTLLDHGEGDGARVLLGRGVTVRRAGLERPAVERVDVDLSAGRALAVTGPNGAGKSSLALALGGLVRPDAGSVEVTGGDGRPVRPDRLRPRRLVGLVGSVFQEPAHQFVASTVADELAVGPRRTGVRAERATAAARDLAERLGLAHLLRANPFTLSGGEQRRLSVGTALATSPALLVLDEPTFGQDGLTWAALVDLLAGHLAGGGALVAVTHDGRLVTALADQVLDLRAGRPVQPVGAT